MDKQARRERIENMITMAKAFHTFEELPLPGRFRKLAEWAVTHLQLRTRNGAISNGNASLSVPWKSGLTKQPSQSSEDQSIRERHEEHTESRQRSRGGPS
jgi:hypothetical protein